MKSKKSIKWVRNFLLLVALLLVCNLAYAKFCIGCGFELPDSATFCTRCTAPQPQMHTLPRANPQSQGVDMREYVLNLFGFIDEFEAYFHDVQYLNILGKMPEMRTRFRNASHQYKQIENRLPEELVILANLYASKFQLLEGVNGVMKNLRLDSGYKDAVLKSTMVAISLRNRIIDEFRSPVSYNYETIKLLKKRVENIVNRTRKHEITSNYMKIGDERGQKGDAVMVLAIAKDKAHVLLMVPTLNTRAVEGVVSLKELERRTQWKKEYEFYFMD